MGKLASFYRKDVPTTPDVIREAIEKFLEWHELQRSRGRIRI
jgi:hypothetical protein